MNFIIEKYLSNFVEIDTSQTKASIFSGIINLKNLKIKNEIFESINLPNFQVVHGYIGNMTIKLKMPRFYKYPINVKIEKVFIHVKQKNIDKILKEDVIKAMEEYKHKLLLNEEELRQKWEKVDNEESNIVQQILNDLQIEIKEVVIHYDDTISYKQVPFTLGIILNGIIIKSANKDFIPDEQLKENIQYKDINYKVFNIDKFSIFMDCFDNIGIFNSQYLSILTDKKLSCKNLFFNEDGINDYYSYCMKELNTYSKNKNSHQYILYKMELKVNISMNNNYLKNNLPHNKISINLPKLNIRFNLKQIKTIFKVMAYYNLNNLYENGIAKEYYMNKLNVKEKKLYIEKYVNYYQEKYYKKNDYLEYPKELSEVENSISFEDIQEMRLIAYKKLDYLNVIIQKEEELKKEEEKWVRKDMEKINKLKEELAKLEKQKQKLKNVKDKNKDNFRDNVKEKYEELNERLNDANSSMNFSINEIRFIIYENTKKNIRDKLWEYNDILIKLVFTSFDIEGTIFQSSLKLLMSLDNVIITQEKTKNPNMQKLFFGDLENRGKVLHIEFEHNPKLENSDYKFIMKGEKKIHILYDLHIFNYIMEKTMNILNTKINFEEIKEYAKQDSVKDYIKSGYVDSFLENFQHFNIDLHIELSYPILLLPLDSFSLDNNKCILLRLGKLEIISDLPPRQEKDKNYKEIKDEKLMYDVYKINFLGTKLSTLTDCTPVNNCIEYEEFETKIVRDFNLTILFKKLIEIKNPFLDDIVCELSVTKVEMEMDEFQILFIIDYIGNFFKNSKTLFEESEIDKFLGIGEEEKDEEKMIQDFAMRYSMKLVKNTKRKKLDNDDIDEISEKISSELSSQGSKRSIQTQDNIDINNSGIKENHMIEKNKEIEEEDEENLENKIIDKPEINTSKKEKIIDDENNSLDKNDSDKEIKNDNNNENEEKETKKKDSFIRINEIKETKRTMRIQFKMNEMSLTIKKIHQDLKRENFLILVQNDFEIEYLMMDNNDMLTMLRMNNIYLFDKDIDEKKNSVLIEQFQCLINSSQNENNNKISFIDMTSLYRKIDSATEIDTIFDMNDLNIIISFDSILRIYQFMMYYYDKYNEMVYEINHPKELIDLQKIDTIYLPSNTSNNLLKRYSDKKMTEIINSNLNNNIKLVRRKKNKNRNRVSINAINFIDKNKKYNKKSNYKKEKIDSKITIVYNMRNTIFKIPLNPKKSDTPIFSFSFNLIYNQIMRNLYINILRLPQNLLIETIYEIRDSKMNLLISKVYLDIVFTNKEPSQFIFENEKVISNFRMTYFSSSFLYINQKQSMTITDLALEPLFCKFGVKEMGALLDFYNKVLSFWFDYNNIKYIPYMKPEYIVNGIVVVKPKKRRTFRECVLKIMIAISIRKGLKIQLRLIRAKYKKENKTKEDNIFDFNSHYEMNIKFGKIIMTFYDNVSAEKRLLLNFNILQFYMKSISNTIIKDKNNASNMIYEMVAGEDLPIEKYNIDTLAYYMLINFGFEINYFNLILNEFEPLMEKINMNYLAMQTCSFSKYKQFLNINDIINFNISSNAIKVVNLFLLRYYQKEEKKENNKVRKISSLTSRRLSSTIKIDPKNIESSKEISLLLINYTELNIEIIFDFNIKKKYPLKAGETLTFYKKDLFLEKNQNNYSSKLNAVFIGKTVIKAINYGRNNTRQYKLKVSYKNKEYDLYVSVKVNTSGIIKQVHFCPSISIYNDTNYKEIEIFIKNTKIKKIIYLFLKMKNYLYLYLGLFASLHYQMFI